VRGYPTVVFCDPPVKTGEALRSNDAEAVAAQMRQFAEKFAGGAGEVVPVPDFPDFSERSFEEARKNAKPLAVYFWDESPGSTSVNLALSDAAVRRLLPNFLFTKSRLRRGSAESAKYDVTRAPTILVLDPAREKPEEKPLARITGSRNAREIGRDLEAALLPGASAAGSSGTSTPSPAPAPLPKAEELSDDEVDRQFIQAQLFVAREWLGKGNKTKAVAILEDILKSYPKHAASVEARKLLEGARK
jgi:hypothetical protein